jgi:hypothetical protein
MNKTITITKEKTIYSLKLHESIYFPEGYTIIRVPNGWIYKFSNIFSSSSHAAAVFVPFDDEFMDYGE